MKFVDTVKLSLYNIRVKRRSYIKAGISFLFGFIMLFVTLFYSDAIDGNYKNLLNREMSKNKIIISEELNEAQIEELKSMDNVLAVATKAFLGDISIEINGIKTRSKYRGAIVSPVSRAVSPNLEITLKNLFNEPAITFGRDIESEDEIIINQTIFDELGINGREFIDKSVTLKIGADVYFKTLVGISNAKLFELYIYDKEAVIIKGDVSGYEDVFQEIDLEDFSSAKDTLLAVVNLYPIDIINYYGENVLIELSVLSGQRILIDDFLSLLCTVIIIVALLNTLNNQIFLLKKNALYYGVLRAQGFRRGHIFITVFLEFLFVLFSVELLAFLFSLGMFAVLKSVFLSVLQVELSIDFTGVLSSIGLVSILNLLFVLFICSFIYFKTLRKPPLELLRT